jgi:hypothetical protein
LIANIKEAEESGNSSKSSHDETQTYKFPTEYWYRIRINNQILLNHAEK